MTNKDVVKAWFAAIDAKDFATVKGLMNPMAIMAQIAAAA